MRQPQTQKMLRDFIGPKDTNLKGGKQMGNT